MTINTSIVIVTYEGQWDYLQQLAGRALAFA